MPLILAELISEFAKNGDGNCLNAQIYGAILVTFIVMGVLLFHPFMMHMMHLAMKMRVAVSSAIYRKALRLSLTALGGTTTGQVVNLVSNDLGRFDRALIHLHFIWLGPLELLIASYFLYQQIGVASFYGIAILLLYLPLQTYLSRLTSALRLKTALRTDRRVRMMNEIIAGIQVIKMYAWELPFEKLVASSRASEMSVIRKVNNIRGVLLSFEITLGRIAIFVSLLAFVLTGGELTAERAFCVTAFYNILRRPVTKFFPSGMTQVAELLVSLQRISQFMSRDETNVTMLEDEEKEDKNVAEEKNLLANGKQLLTSSTSSDILVDIKDLRARWSVDHSDPILDNINMKLLRHQLVAVIGPVGAGKSSLIQAILGELRSETGSVKLHGKCSYAAQEPWLFSATVRENILFGLPLDKQRYRTVVKMCALERDFELLDQGDKTIVGERGASLSGGQKARISLARAVYRKADVYLLDDPLSAVDTHVGRHLFEQCMRGFLRNDLVILVTHQLQFLEQADQIVIMDKGKVTEIGTYEHMLNSGQDFAQLLAQRSLEEFEEEVKDSQAPGGDNGKADSYSRHNSVESRKSVSSLGSSVADSLIVQDKPKEVQESRSAGKIGWDMYQKYFAAGCNWFMFFLVIFLCIGTQVMASWGDYFLSYW